MAANQFLLDNGNYGSRSAYIRQEFLKDRSRGDIAKELDVPSYIVYSATANMYNAVHIENQKGVKGIQVKRVNRNGEFLDAEGNIVPEDSDLVAVLNRSALMRELCDAGMTRKELVAMFDVNYATVYGATKDCTTVSRRGKKVLIHPETGEEIKRADYIRELYDDGEGMTRKEIAAHVTNITGEFCDTPTVWMATRPTKLKEEEVV